MKKSGIICANHEKLGEPVPRLERVLQHGPAALHAHPHHERVHHHHRDEARRTNEVDGGVPAAARAGWGAAVRRRTWGGGSADERHRFLPMRAQASRQGVRGGVTLWSESTPLPED